MQDVVDLVLHLVDAFLHARRRLVELAFALQLVVIGEVARRFLGATLQILGLLTHHCSFPGCPFAGSWPSVRSTSASRRRGELARSTSPRTATTEWPSRSVTSTSSPTTPAPFAAPPDRLRRFARYPPHATDKRHRRRGATARFEVGG